MYGESQPFSTSMPSTKRTETPGSSVSSIVTTPSAPTRSSASATAPPTTSSSLAAIVATLTQVGALHRPRDALQLRHDAAGPPRCRAAAASGSRPRRGPACLRGRSPGRAASRSSCRRRSGRASCSRPRGRAARPCSCTGPQLDLARDRDAVVGDRRRAGEPLEHDVAPLRARA